MKAPDPLAAAITANVSDALDEDVGTGDVTASLVDGNAQAKAIVLAREAMVMAGQAWVNEVFRQVDAGIRVEWLCNDGDRVVADQEICIITGAARGILTGERTALNFLQLLSGTATTTSRYVEAVSGFRARILDTRKTVPGLRLAQKYAVRCGGGENHRVGLYDALLVKENHIIACGGIAAAVQTAKERHRNLPVEVEVESISEVREALEAGADRLLLDNFDIADLQRAVDINQSEGKPPADLEASGNITLDNIGAIAETGIDYISIGALTKHVKAVDLSMRFRYRA